MKRKLIISTLALTALLLSGCTQNNTSGSENPTESPSATPATSTEASQPTSTPQTNAVSNSDAQTEMVSEEEAKQIALEQVPGATLQDIRAFSSDYDNGRLEYEGKIYYEQKEYEFEIDGSSGIILEWDVDPVYEGIQ